LLKHINMIGFPSEQGCLTVSLIQGMRRMQHPPGTAWIVLTEARVILPGAQALLGFQLTVTLTRAFGQLSDSLKLFHVASLCCVAVAIILLMTPAALHRISFAGEDTPSFFTIGSWFVVLAPAPLAIGIAGDLYVATSTAATSLTLGAILALAVLSLF
jgi:uncharacterized protein DUF6328